MKKPARIDDAWVLVGRNWTGMMIFGEDLGRNWPGMLSGIFVGEDLARDDVVAEFRGKSTARNDDAFGCRGRVLAWDGDERILWTWSSRE